MNLIEYINETFEKQIDQNSLHEGSLKLELNETQRDLVSLHYLCVVDNYLSLRKNNLLYNSFLMCFDVEELFWAQLRSMHSESSEFYLMMFDNGWESDLLDRGFFDNGFDNLYSLFNNKKLNEKLSDFLQRHPDYFNNDYLKDNLSALNSLGMLSAFLKNNWIKLTKAQRSEVFSFNKHEIALRMREMDIDQLIELAFDLSFDSHTRSRRRFQEEDNKEDDGSLEIKQYIKERIADLLAHLSGDQGAKLTLLSHVTARYTSWQIISADNTKNELDKFPLEFLKQRINYVPRKRNESSYDRSFIESYIDTKNYEEANRTSQNKEAERKKMEAEALAAKKQQFLDAIKNKEYDNIDDFNELRNSNLTKIEYIDLYSFLCKQNEEIESDVRYSTPSKYAQSIYDAIKEKTTPIFIKSFIEHFSDHLKLDLITKFESVGVEQHMYSDEEVAELFKINKINKMDVINLLSYDVFRTIVDISSLSLVEWEQILNKRIELTVEDIPFVPYKLLKKLSKKNHSLKKMIYVHPETTWADRQNMISANDVSLRFAASASSSIEESGYIYDNLINRTLKDSKDSFIELLKKPALLTAEQTKGILDRILKAKDAMSLLSPYLHLFDDKTQSKLFTASLKEPSTVLSLLIDDNLELKEKERCLNALFKFESQLATYLNNLTDEHSIEFISNKIIATENKDYALKYFHYFNGLQRQNLLKLFSDFSEYEWKYRDSSKNLSPDDVKFLHKLNISFDFLDKVSLSEETLSALKSEKTRLGFYAAMMSSDEKLDFNQYVDKFKIDLKMYKFFCSKIDNVVEFKKYVILHCDLKIERDFSSQEIVECFDVLLSTGKLVNVNHKGLLSNFYYIKTDEQALFKKYFEYMAEVAPDKLQSAQDASFFNDAFSQLGLDHLKLKFNIKIINSGSELIDYSLIKYFKEGHSLTELSSEIVSYYLRCNHEKMLKQISLAYAEYPELTTSFVLISPDNISFPIFEIIHLELKKQSAFDVISKVVFEFFNNHYESFDSRTSSGMVEDYIQFLTPSQEQKIIKKIIDSFKNSNDKITTLKYLNQKMAYFINKVPPELFPPEILFRYEFKKQILDSKPVSAELISLYKKYLEMESSSVYIDNEELFSKTVDFAFENKKEEINISSTTGNTITLDINNQEVAELNTETSEVKFLFNLSETNSTKISKMLEQLLRIPDEIIGEYDIQSEKFQSDSKIAKKYLETLNSVSNSGEQIMIENLKKIGFSTQIKAKLVKNINLNNSDKKYYDLYLNMEESFKPMINEELSLLVSQKNKIEQLKKDIEKMPISNRRWGLELEFSSSQPKMKLGHLLTKAGWNNIQVTNAYRDSDGINWDLKQDSSITSVNGGFTIELASPILIGEDGLAEARKFLDFLFANSTVTVGDITTSGLHIHHEVADLMEVNKDLSLYGKELVKIQEALYSVCSDYRQDNGFCRRLSLENLENYGLRLGARNGFNFTSKGTLEFRMRESLNDTDSIIRWIKITQKIVEDLVLVANGQIDQYNEKALETLSILRKEKMLQNPVDKALSDYLIAEKISKILIS